MLVFEAFYRESLFSATLEDAPNMQDKKKLRGFFENVSNLGGSVSLVFIFMVVFNMCSKPQALYIWCASCFEMTLNNQMKSWYN